MASLDWAKAGDETARSSKSVRSLVDIFKLPPGDHESNGAHG